VVGIIIGSARKLCSAPPSNQTQTGCSVMAGCQYVKSFDRLSIGLRLNHQSRWPNWTRVGRR